MSEDSDVGKVADATGAVAKAVERSFDTIDGFGRFLHRIIGEPLEQLAGTYATDPLREIRRRRLFLLQEKTDTLLERSGTLQTRTVPPKVAVPLLEAASLETDEVIHDLWAQLLAESMNPDGALIDKRYITCLEQFTTVSVQIIQYIIEYRFTTRTRLGDGSYVQSHLRGPQWRKFSISELRTMGFRDDEVAHLVSIGVLQHPLIKPRVEALQIERPLSGNFLELPLVQDYLQVQLALFGMKLVEALGLSKQS